MYRFILILNICVQFIKAENNIIVLKNSSVAIYNRDGKLLFIKLNHSGY